MQVSSPAAVHLPDGNRLDRIRIDLPASFEVQDRWLATVPRTRVQGSRMADAARLARYVGLQRAGLYAPMINTGVIHGWFDEFHDYWLNVLGGRPLTVPDFHTLRMEYRVFGHSRALNWDSAEAHVANWQTPDNLYLIFTYVYWAALNPMRNAFLWRRFRSGMRVLEYGCSHAPVYRTWRQFFSHRRSSWVLADIPNHAFHYTRHTFGRDENVDLVTITPERFSDPLQGVDGQFDLIMLQEVAEHLDRPLATFSYLAERLRPGGMLLLDYIVTDGAGLDTPAGRAERTATLQYLDKHFKPVHGPWRVSDESLPTVILQKR